MSVPCNVTDETAFSNGLQAGMKSIMSRLANMSEDKQVAICPECGRKQVFRSDEWPDDCVCGYVFVKKEDDDDNE